MSGPLLMPRMGETMERGRISAWLKKPGEDFSRGEPILEVETDKTVVEIPATEAGRLSEILVPEGEEADVGAPIGRYEAASAAPVQAAAAAPLGTIAMPRMGETMEEGRISAWLKEPGQAFRRGEAIVEIETDKTVVEVPAIQDGVLLEIVAKAGDTAAVGSAIGRFQAEGAAAPPVAETPSAASAVEEPAAPPPSSVARPAAAPPREHLAAPGRLRATPPARRLARERGLSLDGLKGTGRRGRIERHDIEAALGSPTQAPGENTTVASAPGLHSVETALGRISYRTWGRETASRTILLLHGFAADGGTWAAPAAALGRQDAFVVAPDLPGHGGTAVTAGTFDDLVEAVAAFADALGLQSAEIVAHSLGGAVAARAAATGRLTPRAVTLIAPAGLGGAIDADFVRGMAQVKAGGALAHLLRRLALRPPALSRPQLDAMAATLAQGRLAALADALVSDGRQGIDIVPDLASITTPLRLLWGVEDRIIPWTQVAAAPSSCAVHLIAGAGHMAQWDAPDAVAALL